MSAASDRIRKAREFRVELEEGKFVNLLRPREAETGKFNRDIDSALEAARQFVVWWNLLEQDVMPPGVGSSDPLPCEPDVIDEVLGDHADWLAKVWNALVSAANEHAKKKADAAKN